MTLVPAYTYSATIERWVDGDTVYLTVDLGFRLTITEGFRLFGIDTPERGHLGFKEATAYAEALAPVGSTVIVKTYLNPGKYGRWLAEIYTPQLTLGSVNASLVAAGHAVPYFGGPR